MISVIRHARSRSRSRSRAWALLLALSAGVSSLFAGAVPAHALPLAYCFVYQDNPTPPPLYVPNIAYQTCNATVTKYGAPNQYWVELQGVASPDAVAHVTAVTSPGDPTWCQLVDWSPDPLNPTAEIVHVACYQPGGAPVPARFSLSYAAGAGAPPPGTGYGYLWSDSGGTVINWLSTAGPTPNVVITGLGSYVATFPALAAANPDTGGLQVTAVSTTAARCKVAGWSTTSAATQFAVTCVDGFGNPAYESWTASYQNQFDLVGRPAPALTKKFGYLLTTAALPPFANFNASAGFGVNSAGAAAPVPSSAVKFPLVAKQPDNTQLTAFGATANYCHFTSIAFPWQPVGTTAYVPNIECFTSGGVQVADAYFASYTSVGP